MIDNYFELMGLEKKFNIDKKQLKQNNLGLQKKLHPDSFINQTTAQKMAAANKLAEVNVSYQTLISDYDRGEYLLSLLGVESADESQTIKNPLLLIEQMELREELSELRQLDDAEEVLEKFSEKVEKLVAQQLGIVNQLFSEIDFENGAAKTSLHLISDALVKLRFQNKLQQEILRFEEQLDDY